ncbi:hypothetical protein TS85_03870 [Sphingomonas hengshuiensis]|uniref:DUF2341 domain-containing protein n=2 Tax=Sphingomonas hengshuiensis TaxID=1609977 RepID=A0A7U5CUY9_9SPHN|nr:hypothetical protein TS85_03870 [Sphingomonas hengshuiensis]
MKRGLMAVLMLALAVPVPALAWWSQDWQYRRKVTLDASAVAGLKETLHRVPVLVRLHGGTVDFTQFKPDGSDIRFVAADDKTPLNFHVERFDPAAEIALIWVDVPELVAGKPREIWMYYGGNGTAANNASASFDGEQALVLHFGEANGIPADLTANRNKVSVAGVAPVVDGVVAGGLALKPGSQIHIDPSQSLSIQPGGQMTWSAWLKSDLEAGAADTVIYTKFGSGDEASPDRLTLGTRGGLPYIRVGAAEAAARTPLTPGTWAHLAITADDKQVILYVNGSEMARLTGGLPALGGAEVIGGYGETPGFAGTVDEVGRANTARSASFLAVQAQSQGPLSRFSTVAATAEQRGTESVGYARILVGALTPDAWLIIALLALMAGVSWVVMASKAQLISRTLAANRKFLKALRQAVIAPDGAKALAELPLGKDVPASTLGRIFTAAQEELGLRLGEARRLGNGGLLVPEAVAMVRAMLDATRVEEEQRLSRRMVLLTIAISGGPFLGLLGTVIGVMITFAGVAAAGEVNITAIAPGIAAALVATVAGLAVAIPALFGYNYLNSRLDEVADSHDVFAEELEKRIADSYRPGGSLTSPAR